MSDGVKHKKGRFSNDVGLRKTQEGKDFACAFERKTQEGEAPTSPSAARNSTPAVNLHNENPSLIALGKNC